MPVGVSKDLLDERSVAKSYAEGVVREKGRFAYERGVRVRDV